MNIDLIFSPLGVSRCIDLKQRTAVIIDVLRASSAMVYAFASWDNEDSATLKGVKEIIPAKDIDTARQIFNTLDKQQYLLAGEREGYPPADFHLGNSPFDFVSEKISGKSLVMATTNGTKTLNLMLPAKSIIVGSFINAFAVARKCLDLGNDVVIACAGRWDISSLEDIACGGLIAAYISDLGKEKAVKITLADSVIVAMKSYNCFPSVMDILTTCDHGKYLKNKGLEKDLLPCSFKNKFNIVPVYQDGKIIPDVLHPVLFCSAYY